MKLTLEINLDSNDRSELCQLLRGVADRIFLHKETLGAFIASEKESVSVGHWTITPTYPL